MPKPDEKELQGILTELDAILFRRPVPPPAPAAKVPPEPSRPPAQRPRLSSSLDDPIPSASAPKPAVAPPAPAPNLAPAAAPPRGAVKPPPDAPLFPPEVVPKGARPQEIRRLAVYYTQGSHKHIEDLLGLLEEVGRNVSKQPIYITKVSVEKVDQDSSAKALALKAKLADCAAAIAILDGQTPSKQLEWEDAMGQQRLPFHVVAAADIHKRPVVIDLMIALLVIDPTLKPGHFTWEDHGHSEKHGIRREPGELP